jgi:TonB family protein
VQLLDAAQKKAAAVTPCNWFSATEQPLDSGEIDSHHTLFALLHRIYSRRLTGKLQLVFGRVEKALFFDGGQLVFATSSDSQDGLGEVMLRAGALTQSQFEEASTLVETGQRFGSAIAEMGVYGVEEIVTWVRRQVIQIVASVLDFPAGRYFFFSAPEKNVVPEIGTPVPLGKLLLEAVRKANDLPLDRLAGAADLRVGLSSEPPHLITAGDLEDRERNLLGKVSQRISAKDIVAQSGLPSLEASRGLYALLLLGFVVGLRDTVKAEAKPVVPIPPAAIEEPSLVQREEPKAVEAPSAANIPEQRTADLPAQAEEARASEAPSADNATHAPPPPQLEEIPHDPEEPKETEAPPATPIPLLKANMVSREVPVRATGIPPEKNGLERQLFNEETTSVLVAETGGVIRLSAAVSPGQLLVLANVETKREVIVQVVRKRAYKPTICYLEIEFIEAAPRFWGMEFSAATALLPKNEQDVKAAAAVITAEATADQPGILPPAPDAGEVQTFKREVEELRGKPVLTETPPTTTEASALAQLRAEVFAAAPIPEPGDPLSTEALLKSGMDAAGADAPIKRDASLPAPWELAEQAEPPQPVSDFINSLPRSKRWRLPRGGFTPEFSRVVLGLAILVVVLGVGTAWFKHWLPWQSARAKSGKHAANESMRVASDAPVTSEGTPAKSAPASNVGAPAQADGIEAPVEAASSGAPVEQPALKNNASGRTKAGKPSSVRPAAKPASNSNVTSGKDDVVVPPKLIHSEQAVASLEAMRDFERGNVVIDAVVGTSGEVHLISVISGPPSLRDPAVESLKQYKYEPATRNGQPIPAHVTITIHFRFEP